MARRFFVTVIARNKAVLRSLQRLDVDVFQATSRAEKDGTSRIDGLLTMEEVERLVSAGYQVLVKEDADKKARAREIVDFGTWIEGMKS